MQAIEKPKLKRHARAIHVGEGRRIGCAFRTSCDPARYADRVTSRNRDRMVGAPEYKLTAVRIDPDQAQPGCLKHDDVRQERIGR
jgi:hypothetical protein